MSKEIEAKILTKTYSNRGVASAVVRRAALSKKTTERLLELVSQAYDSPIRASGELPTVQEPSAAIKVETMTKLDQQLLQIAFQLLGLCVEHKLSREEVYSRLEKRLMAGMG